MTLDFGPVRRAARLAQPRRTRLAWRLQEAWGRICLRTFLMKVCVHCPWLASYSMISTVSFALVSFDTLGLAFTSLASWPPSNVEGQVCFSAATALVVVVR